MGKDEAGGGVGVSVVSPCGLMQAVWLDTSEIVGGGRMDRRILVGHMSQKHRTEGCCDGCMQVMRFEIERGIGDVELFRGDRVLSQGFNGACVFGERGGR